MAEQLVQEWLDAVSAEDRPVEEERVLTELSGSLDLGTITFPEFIRSITSRVEQELDLTVAGRGLSLLPRVFTTMQAEPSRNDIHALVPYLCARLEEASPGVHYISRSLQTMSTWKKFLPGDAHEVARAVFKLGASNNFSSQTAITRLSLYELVDTLRVTHPNTLRRDMTVKEIVKGVVTMAELEKNPSCLRALFTLYVELSRDWALEVDDFKLVFDSYIRYFPVTMKDAPKDPSIPSTAELRDLLLECFISSDGYAKMTFEAMIERLDVDSANTKLEVFRTLKRGVKSYGVPVVSEFAPKLWDTLKFEIWNGSNEDWIQSSLDLLKNLAASLDRTPCDWLDRDNAVHKFIGVALTECRDRIRDNLKQYLPTCGRIFNALASACLYSFYIVSGFAIPILDTLLQAHSDGTERVMALEALNGILRARLAQFDVKPLSTEEMATIYSSPEYQLTSESHMINGFGNFRDRIVEIYHADITRLTEIAVHGAGDLSFGGPAIKGMVSIFSIPSYLTEEEKGFIVREIIEIALEVNHKEEIREESLSALSSITGTEPLLFQGAILPAILAKLPRKISGEQTKKEKDLALTISYLESLVRIGATEHSVSQQSNFVAMQWSLVQILVSTIGLLGQKKYQRAILASFSAWFETASKDRKATIATDDQLLGGAQFAPIEMLLSSIVRLKIHYVGTVDEVDETLVRFTGEYIMRVLRDDSARQGKSFVVDWDQNHHHAPSGIWTLFTEAAQSSFVSTQTSLANASNDHCLAVALSMYLVAGSRREDIKLLKFNIVDVAHAMLENVTSHNPNCSPFARRSMFQFLQLLVNKFGAAKQTTEGSNKGLVYVMTQAIEQASSNNSQQATNTYQTLAYFTAASLAALDPSTKPLIQLMLDNIKNVIYGRKVAQSFRLLLAPSEILTKENFCFIRPLRKGRLYELAVKPLIATWRTSQDPFIKENALIAVVGTIAFLEPTMLADNAADIIPVLLEGTKIQDDKFAKEACTKGLLDITPLAPVVVEQHLSSVIDRMTDRIRNTYDAPSDSSVQCRAMALQVLHKLTECVKPNLLLKKKPALMRELDFALEDVSFEVRHKAERCKMAWFNLLDGVDA